MRWTERQRAMLEEIGVRIWSPGERAPTALAEVAPRPAAPPTRSAPEPAAHRAAAGTLATLDWPELAAQAAACTACPLCAGRTHSVFGAGHHQADWMIVGDAPESEDDRSGEPFAGRAGQLLDNMLGALGLTRGAAAPSRQVYVTHTVKCRPPGQRSPEAVEVARCEPFLLRQLQLARPRIILAMGSVAAQALSGSTEAIGKLRGRVHRYAGIAVVVTHHPAYLLRQAQDKAEAWDDLCLAAQTLRDSSPA
ncbi:MAG TPA: uracil-DNA glycosylase [Caldimonas sp.]